MGKDRRGNVGAGGEGRSISGWWVRLLFHKRPPGGGNDQQATSRDPSRGPDTRSHFHQAQLLLGCSAPDEGETDQS